MRFTVITQGQEIVGYTPSVKWDAPPGQFRARLVAGPGQEAHEVEVQDLSLFHGDRSKLLGHLETLLPKKR